LAGRLGDQADLVEAAAWLHDIGYAPAIAVTGFHPLDGARYLRDVAGADEVLCQLVAHHTGAAVEAEERGMVFELNKFGSPDRFEEQLDELTAADLTTSPEGDPISPAARIVEILNRYDQEDPVHRAVTRSRTALMDSVARAFRNQSSRPTGG